MAQANLTELDFDNIKQDLKEYLQGQAEFSDYDFEGSALSVLLDILAYNTHYNAMLSHMLANEAFLDTAIKRTSVVSIAKSLGYTPRSRRSAFSTISLYVVPGNTYNSTTAVLPRSYSFSGTRDGKTYTFYPETDHTVSLETRNGVDAFYFDDIVIKEGTRVSNNFIVSTNISGPFVLPNPNIDTTSIRVRVRSSGTSAVFETYNLNTTILDITSTTKAYWLEENVDGLFVVKFGDGVLGRALANGNIVTIDYLTCSASAPNSISTFSRSGVITSASETVRITATTPAVGGTIKETIASIRKNAPRYNQTKNRAVTSSDYSSLIKELYPSAIESVTVWGGEENDPPIYGKVFISLNPVTGTSITQTIKDDIINRVVTPKAPVAIIPEFVDPEYTFISLRANIVYNNKITTLTRGQIELAANNAITEYFNNNLNSLNKNFYYSRLHNAIYNSSASIVSVNLVPYVQKRITPTTTRQDSLNFTFNTKVQPRELHSTWFNVVINRATFKVKLIDEPRSGVVGPLYSGIGDIRLQKADGTKLRKIGTIDYDTGKVSISEIYISGFYGGDTFIRVTTGLHDDTKDIKTSILTRISPESTSAIVPAPSKNTVLKLDDSSLNALSGARSGVKITASVQVEVD